MKKLAGITILLAAIGLFAAPAVASDAVDGAALFGKKCKACHDVEKKKAGPAIKAMSQDEAQLREVIVNGGQSSMMKAYGKSLSDAEVDALVAHIRTNQ